MSCTLVYSHFTPGYSPQYIGISTKSNCWRNSNQFTKEQNVIASLQVPDSNQLSGELGPFQVPIGLEAVPDVLGLPFFKSDLITVTDGSKAITGINSSSSGQTSSTGSSTASSLVATSTENTTTTNFISSPGSTETKISEAESTSPTISLNPSSQSVNSPGSTSAGPGVNPTNTSTSNDTGNKPAIIAAIVIGSLIIIILIVFFSFLYNRRRRRLRTENSKPAVFFWEKMVANDGAGTFTGKGYDRRSESEVNFNGEGQSNIEEGRSVRSSVTSSMIRSISSTSDSDSETAITDNASQL
ncbi:hypothetical protein K435DRAFT_974156 [Dendrothele bispora CBS 962.96]|uniref:Mid2 domain-containing protein n=1 Tax=Dendrothele bispora (strain CBS 962.96) TaxID=1314807 RepID=A0A4S8KN75_DENBC|nr:hypothetical protein K435DRAFT_974156 [Dendrothele bispora CBS 962.96]